MEQVCPKCHRNIDKAPGMTRRVAYNVHMELHHAYKWQDEPDNKVKENQSEK